MFESVSQSYLEENVLHKEAKPHIVFVTYVDDPYREYLLPTLEAAISEAREKSRHPVDMTIVLADGFGEARPFAEKYQVLYMPTVFVFRRGEVVEMLSAFIPPELFTERIIEASKPTSAEALAEDISLRKE